MRLLSNNFSVYLCITLFNIVFLLSACHHEKVNPCANKSRTKALFKVEESFSYFGKAFNYESDTICTGEATFTVLSDADSVKWNIGSKSYTQRSFYLTFGGIDKQLIPVTLIVYRKPQTDCFPEDKSSDTLTKFIYVAPSATIVYGKYEGYWEEKPSDKFTIDISQDPKYNVDGQVIMANLDKTGCSKHINGTVGYRKIWLESGTADCSNAVNAKAGIFFLNSDNKTVSITYGTGAQVSTNFVIYPHTFIGSKVP